MTFTDTSKNDVPGNSMIAGNNAATVEYKYYSDRPVTLRQNKSNPPSAAGRRHFIQMAVRE